MKQVKIIHLSDVHFRPDKKEEALISLRTVIEKGREEQIDLFAIAGDLFDRALQNTTNSGLPELQRTMQQMMDVAPVVAVTGTPTHDIMGCYDVLQETQAEHGFTVLDPHHKYLLVGNEVFSDRVEDYYFDDRPCRGKLLILGCPEPSKEWFLKDKRMGREEANAAIIDGMRSLLLGMGVKRREHPDIPCLFVYHGNVEGATMCNEQVIRSGEITIGRDDLAFVGADYYALGHIHLAQQIGDMPAYYGGSAYPVNWGEMDQKTFNLIEIEKELPGVYTEDSFTVCTERFPFPHPPRKKIITDNFDEVGQADIANFQTWLCMRIPEHVLFDAEDALEWMLYHGALLGSRVTIDVIPTETVRVGEIQKIKGLREKIKIYAENSGETVTEDILFKADKLEAEARAAGEIGDGLHIVIDKLGLRGATGIRKGLGLDEIWLDFDQYDPGVIALIGANGTGKTTLFRNLQPFPDMADKSGTLQDHFDLADSWRDLYFTDKKTDLRYRAFIQIDGQNETGKCEYHLYRDGQPLTDGRLASYAAKIVEPYGSKELFLRGTYVSQKNTKKYPALSEATKGEKKAIFRELSGLDYLQTYADDSKASGKTLAETVLQDQGRTETLEVLVSALPDKKMKLAGIDYELIDAEKILTGREITGRQAKKVKDDLEEKSMQQGILQQKIDSKKEEQKKIEYERDDLCDGNREYAAALEGKPEAEKQIVEYESLKAQEAKLNEEKAGILAVREELLAEHRNAVDIAYAAGKKVDVQKTEKMQEKADFSTKKATLLANIANLIEKTEKPLDEKCPTCRQILPEGMLDDLRDKREYDLLALKQIQSEEFEIEKEIVDCDKQIDAFDRQKAGIVEPVEPVWPELPEFDEEAFDGVKMSIARVPINSARETLAQAQEAAIKIAENEKWVTQLTTEVCVLESEILELKMKIDPELEMKHRDACTDYENAKAKYIEAREQVKGLEVEQKNLEDQIAELEKQSEELQEIRQSIEEKQTDIADWTWLMRACGPDGIQALELDAMGPGIAKVANKLLGIAFECNPWNAEKREGNPFNQVEFRTTRIGGSGSKRKQIEDFLIFAHDVRDDTWTEISNISGGESVWVIRAIYDAFGIVRDENTGQRFFTVMQDESDGALDPDARLAYFRMLEAAHEESGRRHTLVITHSQDAQEMISQKIEMAEFANQEETP